MPTKDFAELVAEGGGPPEEAPGRWVVHGVHIVHTEGEAFSLVRYDIPVRTGYRYFAYRYKKYKFKKISITGIYSINTGTIH